MNIKNIVVAIVVLGFVYFSGKSDAPVQAPANNAAPATNSTTPIPVATNKVEISGSGFSPANITVKAGDTVTWTNNDSTAHLVASGPHPAHTNYDGTTMSAHCAAGATLSFDACKPIPTGGTYSFTFTKTGDWKYHDHLKPAAPFFGGVKVE